MNSDTKIISIIGVITVLVVAAGVMFAGSKSATSGPQITIKEEALVRADSLRSTGANPKVQIVEFADFECPACAMFHPTLKRIKEEYKDKLDFVFRVIPIHQHSVLAASAVFAAREQNKMIEMHDIVFENQEEWTAYGKSDAEISSLFETYAGQIGLDVAKYKADLAANADKYESIIEQDAVDAQTMGIQSTPTGIINGKPLIRGVITYDALKQMIEAELNGSANTTTASSSAPIAATSSASTTTTAR